MSESAIVWMEVGFNITYLLVVWSLVIAMVRHRTNVEPKDRLAASLIRWAFALLGLGDVAHVGFRVVGYALGDLAVTFPVLGRELSPVGLGALATSITLTFFYVLLVEAWRIHFGRRHGWLEVTLLAAAGAHLLLLIPAANRWNEIVPPQPWSTYRSVPLIALGLGLAGAVLRDARQTGDRAWGWIGAMILVSYACYIPVVLFVQTEPLVGMLMIPKTVAYLVIGFVAYARYYRASPEPRLKVKGQPG